jgi:signal transduction histidine kinase/ligand-binding sensor domain-containing protein
MALVLLGPVLPFGSDVRGQQQTMQSSLDPTKGIDQYVHDVWTVEDGLPSSAVLDIVQTRDGYLWLATTRGLARFDGSRFEVFDASNTPALATNNTRILLEGRDGSLWSGAPGAGLVRYHAGQFTLYEIGDGLVGNVQSLAEDATGTLWLVADGTIQLLRNGELSIFPLPDSIPSGRVRHLVTDRQGAMWFTAARGLYRLNNGRLDLFTSEEGLVGSLRNLQADPTRGVWVESVEGGLYWFAAGEVLFHYEFARDPGKARGSNLSRDLLKDRAGTIWIGVQGLQRLVVGEHDTVLTQWDGVVDERVRAIHEDREGNLWVGTYGGLNRLVNAPIVTHTVEDNRGVIQDSNGNLWVGSRQGIYRRGAQEWSRYDPTGDNTLLAIVHLAADPKGYVWAGTQEGLYRYSPSGARIPTPGGLVDGDIIIPAVGPDGTVWVASSAGRQTQLHVLHDGRFVPVASLSGIPRFLHQDRSGTLWLGTGRGLFRLERGQFIRAFESQTSGVPMRAVYEDDSGTLWIGTVGRGLLRLSGGEISQFSNTDGLFDNTILSILEDDAGHLWMSTDHGVFAISLNDVAAYLRGERLALQSMVFGRQHGMRNPEGNGIGGPTAAKLDDGTLAFTMVGGIATFDPAELLAVSRTPPAVLVEEVQVNGQRVNMVPDVELAADQRRIDIRYTAIALSQPERVHLEHRLIGYDSDWISADVSRTAHYTNLSPGDYEFRVVATDDLGNLIGTGPATAFSIRPFVYETLWFRLGSVLLLAGAISLVYRSRLHAAHARAAHERQRSRQLMALNESLSDARRRLITIQDVERRHVAEEIHDDVNQQLSLVAVRLDLAAARLPQDVGTEVTAAADGVRNIGGSLQRLSRRLHPAHLEQVGLEGALQALCRDACFGTHREVTMRQGSDAPLSPEQAMALYRIAQEALQNVVKHSEAQQAAVTVEGTAAGVRLTVEDDGVGFEPSSANDGLGLITMRDRSRAVGATLNVISAPGSGTRVIVDMPLEDAEGLG